MEPSLLDLLADQAGVPRGSIDASGNPIQEAPLPQPALTPSQIFGEGYVNMHEEPRWTQEEANAASMATGNLQIPVGSSYYAPTPQELLQDQTLGYGFGPPYNRSHQDYPDNRSKMAPGDALDFSSGSAIADNWQDFLTPENRSTGGGFFTASELFGEDIPTAFMTGRSLPSTNNFRLLPPMYQHPNFIMRNGRIINLNSTQMYGPYGAKPLNEELSGGPWRSGAGAGYPAGFAYGYSNQQLGWPGQIGNYAQDTIHGG